MCRWTIKSEVKYHSLTMVLPLILVVLSSVEVSGIYTVAVKCIGIIKNSDCEGSLLDRD